MIMLYILKISFRDSNERLESKERNFPPLPLVNVLEIVKGFQDHYILSVEIVLSETIDF